MATESYEKYKADAAAKIRQWEADLRVLESRMADAGECAIESCEALSRKTREKLEAMGRRLVELREDSQETKVKARAYIDAGMDEVKRLCGELRSTLAR